MLRFSALLKLEQHPDLIVAAIDIATCLAQEQQLIVELMLILFLIFLPTIHLVPHVLRVLLDLVFEFQSVTFSLFDVFIENCLDFFHLYLYDVLDVLPIQSFVLFFFPKFNLLSIQA